MEPTPQGWNPETLARMQLLRRSLRCGGMVARCKGGVGGAAAANSHQGWCADALAHVPAGALAGALAHARAHAGWCAGACAGRPSLCAPLARC